MSARHSTLSSPAAKKPGFLNRPGLLSRLITVWLDRLARSADAYAAAAHLHELEDSTLRDIGIARSEIDAVVHDASASSRS